jgi:hypothetical protein
MIREFLFAAAAIAIWSLAYSLVLPRLLAPDARIGHPPGEGPPSLTGMRNIAWVAVTAGINFLASSVYFALSEPQGDGRLFLILTVCGFLYLLFRYPQAATLARERDPEVRFGALLGGALGISGAFALWLLRS